MIYINPETIQESLLNAAERVQAHLQDKTGERYSVPQLQAALQHWLEVSIEELASEAEYHVIAAGDRQGFNRVAFENQLNKLKPIESVRSEPSDSEQSIAS